MQINIISKYVLLQVIFLIMSFNNPLAQSKITPEQQITTVFDKLAKAYGNIKPPPTIEIIKDSQLQNSPATYYAFPSPVIKIDRNLYNICLKFGDDSLNALAIILSHELAHYYNDHTFCTDFAFAIQKSSIDLSNKLKSLSKTEKIKTESEADLKGLFYACMAGYKPFGIYPQLLDEIYSTYNLSENEDGYPTLKERKDINYNVEEKVSQLYDMFKVGIKANQKGDYNGAIKQFENIIQYFPSRENYNNLGVSKTLKALQNKPISRAASKLPKRFEYPLSIDKESRLKQPEGQRSSLDDSQFNQFNEVLKSAQKDFEMAINLDPNYTQAYVNLACVFDLLGNHFAAIGKINELPVEEQKNESAQRILAIAYYNAELRAKADEIWIQLKL